MKLNDIDVLVAHRSAWQRAKEELANVRTNGCTHIHFGKSTYVTHPDLLKKVKELVIEDLIQRYEVATAKMMQLGITEFPE